MFFKKVKKRVIENNKYNIGDTVSFRIKGDLKVGMIREIYQDDNDIISYDINVGGECPYIVIIKEEEIIRKIQ